jgi:hypothetical protein
MTATHKQNSTTRTVPVLYFSLELGSRNWKLAFTVGLGQKPRLRPIAARDTDALLAEIASAKKRFDLPDNSAIAYCYEAVEGKEAIADIEGLAYFKGTCLDYREDPAR